MSEKKNLRHTLTGLSGGFSTGIGLQLWLFVLFCFYFLGYPIPLSILLGLAAGLGGGWVFGWWKTNDNPKDLQVTEPEEVEEAPAKVRGLRLAKQRRDAARAKKRSQGTQTSLIGFLKR